MEEEIQKAKKAGLKVVLILRVALDHAYPENKFLWHGMIMPQNATLIKSWFRKYGQFVENWAKTSQRLGVDVLGIGSELRALSATTELDSLPNLEAYYLDTAQQNYVLSKHQKFSKELHSKNLWVRGFDNYENLPEYLRDQIKANERWAKAMTFDGAVDRINLRRSLQLEEWQKLISITRRLYSGKLTYAANFDNYQNVAFWEAMDFVGINAYFELKNVQEGAENQYNTYLNSWQSIFQTLKDFSKGKPVIFTELGYSFRKNATIAPWVAQGFSILGDREQEKLFIWEEQPIDYQERAKAMHALYKVNQSYKLLNGILYWKLSTQKEHYNIEPFVLHLHQNSIDPGLNVLQRFVK
ncbi:MAG: hypothetical protein MRY83_11245 [Flavobacteriales bacterium]|nr:hypothetical protein [Flavobacteriales bacterium]